MRRLAILAGFLLGAWLGAQTRHVLAATPEWHALVAGEPETARYFLTLCRLPFPFACALAVAASLRFLRVHGLMGGGQEDSGRLPRYPFDPSKTQLVIGEIHNQDGTPSSQPGWLLLPEKGLTTGILVTGATGSGKTSAAHYPFTAQLIRLHAQDPDRKLGGLVIDAKGNYADFVKRQCEAAGRAADYFEISPQAGVRYNILSRPDLTAPALAGHVGALLENVQGKGVDPFWHQEAKDLATQCIRVIRLVKRREPTMSDLYRVATSPDGFRSWFKDAEAAAKTPAEKAEVESVQFWLDAKQKSLDPKLRSSIAAGLNGICALFDVPDIKQIFCPEAHDEDFRGFDRLISEGQIVALRVPESQLKQVAQVVGTMTKLNFQDAVLNRLAKAEASGTDVGRMVFFVADEYDMFVTQPADGHFLAKCREAKACSILATQTLESLVSQLRNEHVTGQLLANLRTKIWLCAEDNYTARQAADLCGEVEREKVSRGRNETAKAAFSFLDGKLLSAERHQVGESTSVSPRREHLFPPRAFTSLRLNQAIVKAFDGERVLDPWHVYLKPIHQDPNVSWFTPLAPGALRFLARFRIQVLGGLRQAAPFPGPRSSAGTPRPGPEAGCV
jgi:hypothetical protein